MNEKSFVIAIDGPVASGKGTLASILARNLNGFYLYTGAMYRIVALVALEESVDLHDENAVVSLLPKVHVSFNGEQVLLGDRDVTERITEQDTANGSSVVGAYSQVRAAMVALQQQIAQNFLAQGKIVITEGRDTGTKVFPDARVKIYLTATDEVRARRRLAQYEKKGIITTFEEVLTDLHERDERDKTRATDPLPTNPEGLGYHIIDDSAMSEEETLEAIMLHLRKRGLVA